jgi:2-methylcitrate dehydratase
MASSAKTGKRPPFDREIVAIADYVANKKITSEVAYDTARYCLMDTLGCGFEALEVPGLHQAARARSCRARR